KLPPMTRKRWAILLVVSAATAMLLLDVTVVNVALPAIRSDLDASFGEMQWVIDAYALTLAATLLSAGALADRIGRRAVFIWGLALFTACSALCAAATSPVFLDLARAAQGVGAAAMFASSLALLANEFQGSERGFALGVWGAVTGAALAIGPLVGGVLTDELDWRWIFLVNLPIGGLLIWLTARSLPESREERPRPLDPAGMVTFGAACFLATYGLIRGNEDGWGSFPIAASLVGAALLLAAFVAVERRAEAPMLPLSLFRIPAFTGTALVAFAQSVALYPLLLFVAIYLQNGLGLSPTETGLRILPLTLVLVVVAPISGRLTNRWPLRVPLTTGLVLIGAGLLLMRAVDADSEWTVLLPGLLVGGLAIGVISPALAAAMVSVLPVERSGLASGINNTFRQLGIAIGIAGLGAIFEHQAREALGLRAGLVAGLDSVLAVAAVTAFAAAAVAWPLLGSQRSTPTS
ncbi:MAG TPA: MFS transporter, partial [Solirubrobacterales bacterium]|nr:MFS transporter [Solirubrobacterales bacterium]